MRRITTRVITASQDVPTGPGGSVPTSAKLERSLKSPNLVADVYTAPMLTIASGFDGKVQWTKGQNGKVTSLAPGGGDAERAARAALFNEPLTLKQQYARMAVEGTARIDGKDAYIVVGMPTANTPERLYFDVATGLLLRTLTYLETPSGRSPYQQDFEDYRDTGSGVKIPFVIRMSPAGPRTELESTSTLRVTSVKDNVPLTDAVFSKPVPAPQPASR